MFRRNPGQREERVRTVKGEEAAACGFAVQAIPGEIGIDVKAKLEAVGLVVDAADKSVLQA